LLIVSTADASPFALRLTYTHDEYVRGLRAAYDRVTPLGFVSTFVVIAVIVTLVLLAFTTPRPSAMAATAELLAVAAAAFAAAAFIRWLVGYLGLRLYRSKPSAWQTLTVTASAESLELEGFGRRIVAPWNRIRGVVLRGDLFLISLPDRSVHFIPERALVENGVQDSFRNLLQSRLGLRARIAPVDARR
jgi:branched-subunit amino acid ABC-type transport system permease component